jgi:hypothetical protein
MILPDGTSYSGLGLTMKRNGTTLWRQYPLLAAIITQGHQASAGCPFSNYPDDRQTKV